MPFTSFAWGFTLQYGAVVIPKSLVLLVGCLVHACYIWEGVYLFHCECVCVSWCAYVRMWELEREQERKSLLLCIFTRPPTGLFTWNMMAERSRTHSRVILLLRCTGILARKALKALVEYLEVRRISEPSWCFDGRGIGPLYCFLFCQIGPLLWLIPALEKWGSHQCGLPLNQIRMLFCSLTCSEESGHNT